MNFIDNDKLEYFYSKIKNIFLKKDEVINEVYPVGSIYITTSTDSPVTTLGGNWERMAIGRTIVGIDTTQDEFNTAEKSGGEAEVTLTTDNLPAHNHNSKSLTGSVWNCGDQSSSTSMSCSGIFSRRAYNEATGHGSTSKNDGYDGFNANLSHTHTSVGGSGAHNNLAPYQTCYFWKRIEDDAVPLDEDFILENGG